MKKVLFAVFLLAAVMATASTVVLKSEATISGRYVTLYDLASTFDGVSTQTLKEFIVAFAPQPGTHYEIAAESVKIRAQQSIKWLKVETASDRITISTDSYPVDLTKIQKAISSKLATSVFIIDSRGISLPQRKYEVAVETVSKIGNKNFALIGIKYDDTQTYSNVTFETGSIGIATKVDGVKKVVEKELGKGMTLSEIDRFKAPRFDEIEIGTPFEESRTTIGVPVNFMKNGIVTMTTVLKYAAHRFLKVVVAAKPINYGQKLSEDLLGMKYEDVYATTTQYATSLVSCVGKVATWSFSTGQVVSTEGLKAPPDVLAGQILIAYINYPGLTVTAFVRSMRNGDVGQIIPIRNVDNGYLLYGLIEKGPRILVYSGGE